MPQLPVDWAISVIKRVTGTDPAANTECSDAVPAGKFWYVMAVTVQCVQGATQTPWPSLVIDDGATTVFQAFCGTAAMSVSTTTQCTWAPSLTAVGSAASTANTGPLPSELVLPSGYRLRTVTTGIGANTNYGAPSYLVCEIG